MDMRDKRLPKVVKDVGFDFSWSEEKVWSLNIPVEKIDIKELEWHFEIPFWSTKDGFYDLRPSDVLTHPEKHKDEFERTMRVDLSHPLDIMWWKNKWLLLDGLHRLVKASQLGWKKIKVRKVPKDAIPLIQKRILVFTEGTVIMHKGADKVSREERVKKSRIEGIQREESSISYSSKDEVPVEPQSVHDYSSYIPIGNPTVKLNTWKDQGVEIHYLTSRRVKHEVKAISEILQKCRFPDFGNLHYRQQGEEYQDVVEKVLPDILIEDDCESITTKYNETVYPNLKPEVRDRIKSIVIKEFEGIDHLPDNI